jgi:hypothetical protein
MVGALPVTSLIGLSPRLAASAGPSTDERVVTNETSRLSHSDTLVVADRNSMYACGQIR